MDLLRMAIEPAVPSTMFRPVSPALDLANLRATLANTSNGNAVESNIESAAVPMDATATDNSNATNAIPSTDVVVFGEDATSSSGSETDDNPQTLEAEAADLDTSAILPMPSAVINEVMTNSLTDCR
jgi:hypothetical protein